MHLVDGGVEAVLAGWAAEAHAALASELRRHGLAARSGEAGTVVAIGPELSPADAAKRVGELPETSRVLVFAAGDDLELFQDLVDRDRIYFLSRRPPSPAAIAELIATAAKQPAEEIESSMLDVARRTEPADVAREAATLAHASKARLWLYDPQHATLTEEHQKESAAAGITSYVARTGRAVAIDRAGDDARFDGELDGDADDRLLAIPIAIAGRVLAVLTLTRPAAEPSFDEAEQQRVETLASLLAPGFLERHLENRAKERHAAIRDDVARLFRAEALDEYQRGPESEGHPLELEPRWTRYAYRVIVALLVVAALFATFVHVDRVAHGAGVVRDGRLVGVVPARYRAQLRPAMPLRFELVDAQLPLTAVSTRIVPASEARRVLGADGAALWSSSDPAMRVEAPLPNRDLGDGVAGRVRIRFGRERLLFALLPALRGSDD